MEKLHNDQNSSAEDIETSDASLGEEIQVYRGQTIGGKIYALLFLLFIFGVLIPFCVGLWLTVYGYTRYGFSAVTTWSKPWFIASAIIIILLVFYLIYRRRLSLPIITLHENGLTIRSGFSKTHKLNWIMIEGISENYTQDQFLGLTVNNSYSATIYPLQNPPLCLKGNINNLPDLIKVIKSKIRPALLPKLRVKFNTGKWVKFGSFAIRNTGFLICSTNIFHQNNPIPWSNIDKITFDQGYLVLSERQSGKNRKITAASIMNCELMLKLINEGAQL